MLGSESKILYSACSAISETKERLSAPSGYLSSNSDVRSETLFSIASSSPAPEASDAISSAAFPWSSFDSALFIAGERFKRTVLRALDYLPPGEVSFADFGRALLASDQASHPDSGEQRDRLKEEFQRRGIVANISELEVRTNYKNPAVSKLDLDELVRSDWYAYQFANRNRSLLGIPARVSFEVRPRLDVTKKYYHEGDEPAYVRECLFKVSWSETEPIGVGGGLPAQRRFARGTTLAIDWNTKTVRATVTGGAGAGLSQSRDLFLQRLLARDALRIGAQAQAPDGKPLRSVVSGDVIDETLRLRATARALHMFEERCYE